MQATMGQEKAMLARVGMPHHNSHQLKLPLTSHPKRNRVLLNATPCHPEQSEGSRHWLPLSLSS